MSIKPPRNFVSFCIVRLRLSLAPRFLVLWFLGKFDNPFSLARMSIPYLCSVWTQIAIDGVPCPPIEFDIFDCDAGAHFRDLCSGRHGGRYEGNKFHAVHPGSAIYGGDITSNSGTANYFLWGREVLKSPGLVSPDGPGYLVMTLDANNRGGSMFMITLFPTGSSYVSPKETCFGRARNPNHATLAGLSGIKSVSGDYLGAPRSTVRIMGCGLLGP
ncbi:cyclophilin-like domain-containing protein [Cantharellus anzutake]|uniref:cyclophilin-like domain-containing protein n=1 Tax=Cantharellus anzutake TaxID=1750568 RepID=UPI001906CE12|nr:cyclophilin-like domain-containing protein [Cantharellus anzutake]KAF8325821.1 cyclophilin-like domain-containing protein [Cantharellus anzutake]